MNDCTQPPPPQADSQPSPSDEAILSAARNWGDVQQYNRTDGKGTEHRIVFNMHHRAAHFASELLAARAPADSVCYDYAKQIAESMWATHYKADAPHWKSCDSLMGVLSQISNMMCGLSRAPADSVTAPAAFQRALDIRTAQGWKLGGDKVPVLYTDTINGKQVCRDDLWLCTTAAFATPPTQTADSVTAPASGAVAGPSDDEVLNRTGYAPGTHEDDLERDLIRWYRKLLATPPTHAAGSVLEDAARYRYLRDGDWREHEKLEAVIRLQLNVLWDATIDDARKQGCAT